MVGIDRNWGGRAQIRGTFEALQATRAATPTAATGRTNPLVDRFETALRAGASTGDEVQSLTEFRAAYEAAHGPVLTLDRQRYRHPDLFAAQKALALTAVGRAPSSVRDGFVRAAGSIDGAPIAPRDVFFQRFEPTAPRSGKVVVVSPGFQETGRSFNDQIERLSAQGHTVLVLDHQWLGQTQAVGGGGKAGGVDRGFGVARDVLAVAAVAADLVKTELGGDPVHDVVLYGNSMGAGPGVLVALAMQDAGRAALGELTIDTGAHGGPRRIAGDVPQGLSAVLVAPFLAPTPSAFNKVLALASRIPVVNRFSAYSTGLPVLTTDPTGARRGAQSAVLEDGRAQLAALSAATDDVARAFDLMQQGGAPRGRVIVLHGDEDPLADPARSRALQALPGGLIDVRMFASPNHVHQQTPGDQDRAVRALAELLAP